MSWSSDDVMNRATMFEAAAICYPDNDYEADYGSTGVCQQAFIAGAEWYAAGMAVCAFLEDLSFAVTNGCIACGDRVARDADLCAPCRERGCCSICGDMGCYP